MKIPRVFKFSNYKTTDVKEYLSKGLIEIHLERDLTSFMQCNCCGEDLSPGHGSYPVKVQHMPIFNNHCYLIFRRHKGYCSSCKRVRSERVSFVSKESPHKSVEYAWWIGRMCEIASVSRVAELMKESSSTTWRLDFRRMRRMASKYKIPRVRRICVDEVYTRRKKERGETRDDLFFTIICDLDTGRAIWVSSSRSKEALDEFFLIIGKKACGEIRVVSCDLHKAYAQSVREHCPNALLVWDRFHVMQIFDEAVNETRKDLHGESDEGSEEKRLSRGKFRFMFLKKSSRRSEEEQSHIDYLFKSNECFLKLEIIKEAMHEFYRASHIEDAKTILENIGDWIWQAQFKPLMKWHNQMERGWETLKNYFTYKVTSALSEGMNNVIKTIKKKAYGYRNMDYFKLKILQVCGYLNSRYITDPHIEQI